MEKMGASKKRTPGRILLGAALVSVIGAAQSCAPRPVYRTPLPPSSRAPLPAPAPQPPPVQETLRNPLPQDSKIKEQNLPTKGTSTAPVLKDEPAGPGSPGSPTLPPALPDDSSLLAKITPGTAPQRAASLRLTEEGKKLLDSGDATRALNRLERTIAVDSTNGYGYFYLAKAHYKLGRYRESLNFLDVAESRLAGEPFWLAEVFALRGENFRALGMAERAEASFSRALSINSGNRTASEALSRVHNDPTAGPR
jgi:hypothetical protein